MQTHRLRSPAGDGSLLADPPLPQAAAALDANIDRLHHWDHDFQGRRAPRLRAMARSQVIHLAKAYHERYGLDVPTTPASFDRMVVTGHQPELFHPGVWVKNFAVAGMARASGAVGLNLIVDNDIPKGPSIRVPFLDGNQLRARPVAFDVWSGESPYEDQRVQDEAMFAGFADQVRSTLGDLLPRSMLAGFWTRVLARRGETDRVGLRFALARREQEAAWGVANWEVPIGQVCETEAFAWFAAHLLAHLPRFQATHNAALARYRAAYGIRSKNHPVPALGRQGEWLEAPFWVWRSDAPRRKSLLARQLAQTIELRIAGEDSPFAELPLNADRDACCAIEPLADLPARGIRLRTRALTTTLFARYILGDLFVHGIGGAKYDELGDELARGFFGIEPPTFLTLSLTRWLDLPDDPASAEQARSVERTIRDLDFNPDRHLGDPRPAAARAAVEAKWIAIEGEVATRAQRKTRLRVIRQANRDLAPLVEPERRTQVEQLAAVKAGLKLNTVAHSREYAFPLHDGERLGETLLAVAAEAD